MRGTSLHGALHWRVKRTRHNGAAGSSGAGAAAAGGGAAQVCVPGLARMRERALVLPPQRAARGAPPPASSVELLASGHPAAGAGHCNLAPRRGRRGGLRRRQLVGGARRARRPGPPPAACRRFGRPRASPRAPGNCCRRSRSSRPTHALPRARQPRVKQVRGQPRGPKGRGRAPGCAYRALAMLRTLWLPAEPAGPRGAAGPRWREGGPPATPRPRPRPAPAGTLSGAAGAHQTRAARRESRPAPSLTDLRAVMVKRAAKRARPPPLSLYKGLAWDKHEACWRVRISLQGKQHHLGRCGRAAGRRLRRAARARSMAGRRPPRPHAGGARRPWHQAATETSPLARRRGVAGRRQRPDALARHAVARSAGRPSTRARTPRPADPPPRPQRPAPRTPPPSAQAYR
jgi:hypothetical protein